MIPHTQCAQARGADLAYKVIDDGCRPRRSQRQNVRPLTRGEIGADEIDLVGRRHVPSIREEIEPVHQVKQVVARHETLLDQLAVSAAVLPCASFLLGEKGITGINSLVLAIPATVIPVMIAAFAAYAFSFSAPMNA